MVSRLAGLNQERITPLFKAHSIQLLQLKLIQWEITHVGPPPSQAAVGVCRGSATTRLWLQQRVWTHTPPLKLQ